MDTDLSWQNYKAQILHMATLDYNYDEKTYHSSKDKAGWFIDKYHASIGYEEPGDVVAGGIFQKIIQCINLYQFPDPKLIYAVFDPDAPLFGRNMYMVARFYGMTFNFGVRVVGVIDDIKYTGEVPFKRWGYSYRTLKGHFEVGEISFLASKNLKTGEILFDVEAYSKPDKISNPFYRLGFKIFGRSLQRRFAASSINRLKAVAAGRSLFTP